MSTADCTLSETPQRVNSTVDSLHKKQSSQKKMIVFLFHEIIETIELKELGK